MTLYTTTMTPQAKNWLVDNAGNGTSFVSSGITYYTVDDGLSHTGSTADVVSALYGAYILGLTSDSVTENGKSYNDFKAVNNNQDNNQDLVVDDVLWAYQHTGDPAVVDAGDVYTKTADICSWIDSKGGATAISSTDFAELIMGYTGLKDIGFSPTSTEIAGVVMYYISNINMGNNLTGCNE